MDQFHAHIYKYQLPTSNTDTVAMPKGAQILCVQVQKDTPYIWALVDPDLPTETRRFSIYGTGWDITSPPGKYVGTFQLASGLVFHVFEERD